MSPEMRGEAVEEMSVIQEERFAKGEVIVSGSCCPMACGLTLPNTKGELEGVLLGTV